MSIHEQALFRLSDGRGIGAFPLSVVLPTLSSMTMLPVSEARRRFSEIADEVARTHDRVQVTRHGREHVVLIATADLGSLEATIELLSDPAAMVGVKEADEAIAAGDVVTRDEMAAIMDERRREETGAWR